MSWENILKETIRDKWGERMDDRYVRRVYDWFMTTHAGKKHEAGNVHDGNLLYILTNHIIKIFSEGDKEYDLAKSINDKILVMLDESHELYEILKKNHQEELK